MAAKEFIGDMKEVSFFYKGQSSFIKKMPKIGVQKREEMLKNRRYLRPLYLDTLQQWIKLGRIDASKPITIKDICNSGVAGKVKDGVVLLAKVVDFELRVVNSLNPKFRLLSRKHLPMQFQ
jgi:ribosomal protein L15